MHHRLTLIVALMSVLPAAAAEPTYWQDVRPVLRKHCIACHNRRTVDEVEVSGGLALDAYDSFMKKGRKPYVRPGKSAASLIIQRVTHKDEDQRMPPGGKRLPADALALLRRWIDSGAAEGRKLTTTTPVVTAPSRPRRKLPVSLATARPDKLTLTLQAGPLAPVTAVAFSPDGKLLAVGCYGRAAVWDLAAARPVKVLTNVLGAVNDLRFSPDGKLLAVAGGQPSAKGDLRLYQTTDWKLLAVLGGHEDVVASVCFRPDGKQLASASFDKTVRVWDLATHRTVRALTGHSDFVYAVTWSGDGKFLATASKDRTAKLIDAATGKSRFTFSGMTQDVLAVAFSGDGKYVISSGYESRLYWWNVATGERGRLQSGHGVAVHEIAVSKGGKLVASAGGDATVRLWNGSTGALVRTLSVGSLCYAAAVSADGRLIASGSFDGLVRLWDAKTGRQLATLLTLPARAEEAPWLALTPEGYTAASKELTAAGQWRVAGKVRPAAAVWLTLAKPDAVVRALRGGTLSVPAFPK